MNRPVVSIVTPSYNQGEFIEDTILSVKNQKYPDVEHIVIDGGSSDETVCLLEQYEGTYDLHWVSEEDDGQSDAINKGFEMARGEIVAWINSDDVYFDTSVIERVVGHFNDSDDDIIYGDQVIIDEYSIIKSVDIRPNFDVKKLSHRVLIGQAGTFFRSEVVVDEKLRTDLDYCMDYEYWLRLSQHYSFRHVNDIFAGFRVYDAQKSNSMAKMSDEFDQIMADYPALNGKSIYSIISTIPLEIVRWTRAVQQTWNFHTQGAELAFDGDFDPLATMVVNVPPDGRDVVKVLNRLRKSR